MEQPQTTHLQTPSTGPLLMAKPRARLALYVQTSLQYPDLGYPFQKPTATATLCLNSCRNHLSRQIRSREPVGACNTLVSSPSRPPTASELTRACTRRDVGACFLSSNVFLACWFSAGHSSVSTRKFCVLEKCLTQARVSNKLLEPRCMFGISGQNQPPRFGL